MSFRKSKPQQAATPLGRYYMSVAVAQSVDAQQELTDGFHLVIDALKLNDINTIYAVPGIPISDLCRMAQGEGIRVISFRHEQNAGTTSRTPATPPRSPDT